MITCRATCTDTKDFLSKKKIKTENVWPQVDFNSSILNSKTKENIEVPMK